MNKKAAFYKYAKLYTYRLKVAARLWNPNVIPKGSVRYNRLKNEMQKIYNEEYAAAEKYGWPLSHARENIENGWKALYSRLQPVESNVKQQYQKSLSSSYDTAVYETFRDIQDASKGKMDPTTLARKILEKNTAGIQDAARKGEVLKQFENGRQFLTSNLPKEQRGFVNNLGLQLNYNGGRDGAFYHPNQSMITLPYDAQYNVLSIPFAWHEGVHGATSVLPSKPITEAINNNSIFQNVIGLASEQPINVNGTMMNPRKLRFINETRSNFIPRNIVAKATQNMDPREAEFIKRITDMETGYSQNTYNKLVNKPQLNNMPLATPRQLRKFNRIIERENMRNKINVNEMLGVQSADKLFNAKEGITGRPNILQQAGSWLEKGTQEYEWFMQNKAQIQQAMTNIKRIQKLEARQAQLKAVFEKRPSAALQNQINIIENKLAQLQ